MTSLVFCGILATAIALVAEKVGFWLLGCVWPENSLIYQLIEIFRDRGVCRRRRQVLSAEKAYLDDPAFNFTFDGVVYAALCRWASLFGKISATSPPTGWTWR
ncbi:MAG: hypothetical protein ACLUE8_15870 [Lachnospiraceae bacterium]